MLAIGAAIYVWRDVQHGMRADAEFFTTLVGRLAEVLQPKGFRLTRQVHLRQSFGHRIATFQGPTYILDAAWDGRERDILLLRRELEESNVSAGTSLAGVHISQDATPSAYAEAIDTIVAAARVIEGAA